MKVSKLINMDLDCAEWLSKQPNQSGFVNDLIHKEMISKMVDKYAVSSAISDIEVEDKKKSVTANYQHRIPKDTRNEIETEAKVEICLIGNKYSAGPDYWELCYKKARERGYEL